MTQGELEAIVHGIAPIVREYVAKAVHEAALRTAALEGAIEAAARHTDLAPIRERLATLETRAPVPGPAGAAGKDGADGLSFDDLTLEQTSDRTFTVKAVRGELVKAIGTITIPVSIYRGVWEAGREYEHGDCVTSAGSVFHCNEATTSRPGDGSSAWTLQVKRGRDGRDGKAAAA